MKKQKPKRSPPMRAEYDFSRLGPGVRGKHLKTFRESGMVALLDPDVAQAFPTSDAVNEALRLVSRVMELSPRKKPRRGKPRPR